MCALTNHHAFVDLEKEIIGTSLIEFILNNKVLNSSSNLSKLVSNKDMYNQNQVQAHVMLYCKTSEQDNYFQGTDDLNYNQLRSFKNNTCNVNLTMAQIVQYIDENEYLLNSSEQRFRLHLINYCCINYLKYTEDINLMTFLNEKLNWKMDGKILNYQAFKLLVPIQKWLSVPKVEFIFLRACILYCINRYK